MILTLFCALLTVVFFIMSQLSEGKWKWGDENLQLEYSSAFFTGNQLKKIHFCKKNKFFTLLDHIQALVCPARLRTIFIKSTFCLYICGTRRTMDVTWNNWMAKYHKIRTFCDVFINAKIECHILKYIFLFCTKKYLICLPLIVHYQ